MNAIEDGIFFWETHYEKQLHSTQNFLHMKVTGLKTKTKVCEPHLNKESTTICKLPRTTRTQTNLNNLAWEVWGRKVQRGLKGKEKSLSKMNLKLPPQNSFITFKNIIYYVLKKITIQNRFTFYKDLMFYH